jgi:hypothetical protein
MRLLPMGDRTNLEILALRHQLIVLQRPIDRPQMPLQSGQPHQTPVGPPTFRFLSSIGRLTQHHGNKQRFALA